MNRHVLTALFFVFGFLPTLALTLWGGVRKTAWYVDFYREKVENFVGIPVELDSAEHLAPRKTRLHGLKLYLPPEFGSSERTQLADISQLEIWDHDLQKSGKTHTQMNWRVPEMTLDAACLEPLWLLHQRTLARVDFWKTHDLVLAVDGTLRVSSDPIIEIQNAKMHIYHGNSGPQTDISFQIPDGGKMTEVRISLYHVQQKHSSVLVAVLSTDDSGLSTTRLAGLFPTFARFGANCRYFGIIRIQQSFHGWSGIFEDGTFQNIALDTIFPGQNALQGTGTLRLDYARFDSSQLTQAEGNFKAQDGMISRALIDKILSGAQLSTRGIPLEPTEVQTFREFAFSFKMQNSLLLLTGQCTGHGPGVFLTNPNGPVLCESTRPRQPMSAPAFFEVLERK